MRGPARGLPVVLVVVLVVVALGASGCGGGGRGVPPPPASATTTTPQPTSPPTSPADAPAGLPALSYVRAGGRTPPPDRERLEVGTDGRFVLQRAVRAPAVGTFRGSLTAAEATALAAAVQAAVAAGRLDARRAPDAAGETIEVGGTSARFGGSPPPGPWGGLATLLRTLTADLVRAPAAAVALEVAPRASRARLVHVGSEPLAVDLGSLSVTAVLSGPDGTVVERWQSPPKVGPAEPRTAGPGWEHALAFDHGLAVRPGQTVQVSVAFTVLQAGTPVGALATAVA